MPVPMLLELCMFRLDYLLMLITSSELRLEIFSDTVLTGHLCLHLNVRLNLLLLLLH